MALVPICVYMTWLGEFPKALRTQRPALHATGSIFGAFSMAMSFLSLAYLPAANEAVAGAPVSALAPFDFTGLI